MEEQAEHTKIKKKLPYKVQGNCNGTILLHGDEHGAQPDEEGGQGQETIFLQADPVQLAGEQDHQQASHDRAGVQNHHCVG